MTNTTFNLTNDYYFPEYSKFDGKQYVRDIINEGKDHLGANMKPLIICYSDQSSYTLGSSLQKYIERNLDAELELVDVWTDLVLAITRKPVAIIFHSNLVDPKLGCKILVDKIKRLSMRSSHKINIGAYLEFENSSELVDEMKSINLFGIVPNPEQFGIDTTVEAMRNIMNGKPHWPNDIIACLPQQTKIKTIKHAQKIKEAYDPPKLGDDSVKLPNIVYYLDTHQTTHKCTTALSEKLKCTWSTPSTWQQLTKEIEDGAHLVATHIEMIERSGSTVQEFVDMLTTLVKFIPKIEKIKIGVVITKKTTLKRIQELRHTQITGILLDINDYDIDEVALALAALIAGTHYWPEHIIKELPGNKPNISANSGITLTERQSQIASLICKRGLSNKKVANMLNITESTVKAHVSAILKAYGVRNRTQLVVSAKFEAAR